MNKFHVEQSGEHPALRGYGFDGIRVGDSMSDAEDLVNFINSVIEMNQDLSRQLQSLVFAELQEQYEELRNNRDNGIIPGDEFIMMSNRIRDKITYLAESKIARIINGTDPDSEDFDVPDDYVKIMEYDDRQVIIHKGNKGDSDVGSGYDKL